MVDVWSQFKAASLMKVKSIANASSLSEFWVKFAFYNIGSTLKLINDSLYNNRQPHRTVAFDYWYRLKKLILETVDNNMNINWEEIKFKELSRKFKLINSQSADLDKPWMNIHLLGYNKFLFANFDREVSFLVAQDAVIRGREEGILKHLLIYPHGH